jgi:hypothetical protein
MATTAGQEERPKVYPTGISVLHDPALADTEYVPWSLELETF